MNKLLIVGTVAFDSIETPDDKVEKILGGSASHASISASLFNIKTAIVSIVGWDFPEKYFEIFNKKGVDTSALIIEQNEKKGIKAESQNMPKAKKKKRFFFF